MRRLYIYYNSEDTDLDLFEIECIVNDVLGDFIEGGASFGNVDDRCRFLDGNQDYISFGMVDITEDADIDEVTDLIEEEFLADGIELIDIQIG